MAALYRHHRLLGWATLLERNPHQIIGLLSPSWAGGDARGTMVDRPSAIDVAWSDVVLRVMGLAGRSRGEAKSFFGLSDAELDRIAAGSWRCPVRPARSEEHTSELQSLMRISYSVFCLKKKNTHQINT